MKPDSCLVVTVLPCFKSNEEYEAENCSNCDMLNWMCFKTEEIANEEFMKQYPEWFENGIYKGNKNDEY